MPGIEPEAVFTPHSQPPSAPLASAANLVLIDNYDSFTWNVYQYLVLEGAIVTVYRNDEITLDELVARKPSQLVVSPGPGHPEADAGISRDAIKYFAGKIPVLGVCMGEQCIYSAFGGRVDVTGEILHGKTSPLRHDGKGVYAGIPQDIPVTRYHSLAGTHPTLPECLEVSSWIAIGPDGGKGVIMGVRHKELLVEGVQFHPESILTAEGRTMLKNFLRMRGGTWVENERFASLAATKNSINGLNGAIPPPSTNPAAASILETIYDHRKLLVAAQKELPSQRPEDLKAAYQMNLSPPLISFPDRLKQSPYPLSLMAEIKRASPSKGMISLSTCAPAQARTYALAGASVISVLTEPEWFKGSLEDLRYVRRALESMPNRPAILRKEFIFDEYQILEARLAGADTVLLIVKMLDESTLRRLYLYSQSVGMEPLVEVNTVDEMRIAVNLGAKVIGVNNRNLTNFEVDLETTSRLMSIVPQDTIVCALSGIGSSRDVEPYLRQGVGAVLVGEALMRAGNEVLSFVEQLLGGSNNRSRPTQVPTSKLAVKICGTRSAEAAKVAIEAGADMIGIILVSGRSRCVTREVATAISAIVHSTPKGSFAEEHFDGTTSAANEAKDFFQHTSAFLRHPKRALLVGVFQNQPLEYILEQQQELSLDIVQLHGEEPLEWAHLIPCPVISAFNVDSLELGTQGYHSIPLLDSGIGGSGETLDISRVRAVLDKNAGLQIILAGGMESSNVSAVLSDLKEYRERIIGVDVSSGVEQDGIQNAQKIRDFVRAAKSID